MVVSDTSLINYLVRFGQINVRTFELGLAGKLCLPDYHAAHR